MSENESKSAAAAIAHQRKLDEYYARAAEIRASVEALQALAEDGGIVFEVAHVLPEEDAWDSSGCWDSSSC